MFARFATDEGFVRFDFSVQLAAVLGLKRKPQTRQHEPRGFLGDTERARQFVTADAILAVGEQPERGKPLLKADSRILKDGSDLERELRPWVLFVALVAALLLKVGDVLRTAGRAGYRAIGPANRFDGLTAVGVVREKQNRFAEGFGYGCGSHEPIMAGC
jgi:hypothetical protein